MSITTPPAGLSFAEGRRMLNRLEKYQDRDGEDNTVLLLQTCFVFLRPGGQRNLFEDLESCKSDDEVYELAQTIDMALLRPIFANAGLTPKLGSSVPAGKEKKGAFSRPNLINELWALKHNCLQRDGNQCVISGWYDQDWIARRGSGYTSGPFSVELEVVHILPSELASSGDERKEASDVRTTLYRYFPSLGDLTSFSLENINCEENALMIHSSLRLEFARFRLSLQRVSGHPFRFKVLTYQDFPTDYMSLLPRNGVITFRTHDARYSLPSTTLLSVHDTIAKILQVSGQGNKIKDAMWTFMKTWEKEEFFIRKDGSTDLEKLLSMTSLPLLASKDQTRH